MKKLLMVLVVLVFLFQNHAFAQLNQQKVLYLKKIESYKRMRSTGIIMGSIGLVTGIVGITMVSQEERNYNSSTKFVNEDRLLTGLSCIVVSVPLTAAGTVFGLIGTHKVRKYRDKLDNMSFNIKYGPNQKGLVMRYTF